MGSVTIDASDSQDAQAAADLGLTGSDHPIERLSSDRLGRAHFACALADEILRAPAEGGYVMGLTGPWGSGKTSILNMTVDALGDRALVVQFNPWLFSGTEALLGMFFREVGKQLGEESDALKELGAKLADYGRVLSPLAALVGAQPIVDSATAVLDKWTAGPSIVERRQELREQLLKLDRRLVVVIDDVDRLRPEEVRDIVRLVRLVGDFPNTLYLLAFDRRRVEECLGEGDLQRGRAYLEKIIQVAYDVPLARGLDINIMVVEGLGSIMEGIETGPFDSARWANVFSLIIRPLLETPRQARRYLQSLPMTLRLIGDEVALTDVLVLEAVRVTNPEMFDAIVRCQDALGQTRAQDGGYLQNKDPADGPLAAIVKVDAVLAKSLAQWLFPAALRYFANNHYGPDWLARWRQERRVAHPDVLRFYLELRLPDGVAPADSVDAIVAHLDDGEQLTQLLTDLRPDQLVDATNRVVGAIGLDPLPENYQFSAAVRTALPIFLDQFPRFPAEQGGFGEDSPRVVLGRLAVRLLERIADQDDRANAIRSVLDDTHVLAACVLLVTMVGNREHTGMDLIDELTARQLEEILRERLLQVPPELLAAQILPLYLAEFIAETTAGADVLRGAAQDDGLFLRLIGDARVVIHSFNVGEVAVRRHPSFAWDRLTGVLGESFLCERIADLSSRKADGSLGLTEEEAAILDLATLYASGWRPDDPVLRLTGGRRSTGTDFVPNADEGTGATEAEEPDEGTV